MKIVINKDTIEIGKYYTFFISNYESFLGKVTASDKTNILVYTNGELRTIKKMDIVSIENVNKGLWEMSVAPKIKGKDRVYWSFGAGYLLRSQSRYNYDNDKFSDGFNLHGMSLVTFDNNFGLRTDLDYNHIPKNDVVYPTYSYSGGTINSFLLRVNAVIGSLYAEDNFNVYAIPGIGIGYYFRTAESNSNYVSYGGTYNYTGRASSYFTIGISAGIGFSVKISEKMRCYFEPQYNTWTGDFPNYFAFKTGITLIGR